MYSVVFISSGIVAYKAHSKAYASEWLRENNTCPRTGKSLGLFVLKKQ